MSSVSGHWRALDAVAHLGHRIVGDRWALAVLLARAGRWRTVGVLGAAVGSGSTAIASILASGLLIGSIPGAVHRGLNSEAGHRALVGLGLVLGLSLLSGLLGAVQGQGLSVRYVLAVRETLARIILGPPGIAHLEDPTIKAELVAFEHVDDTAGTHSNIGWPLLAVTSSWVSGIGTLVLLLSFHWWVPVLLLAGWLVVNRSFRAWVGRGVEGWLDTNQGPLRRAAYFRNLALEPSTAKELRLFGLAAWTVEQFASTWQVIMATVWRQRRSANRLWIVGVAAVGITHAVVFSILGLATANGRLSITDLTIYTQAVLGSASLGMMSDFPFFLGRAATVDRHLLDLEQRMKPKERPQISIPDLSSTPATEVRFEGIRFTYPGQSRVVLDELDLVIPAGQSLAIVGTNGAGKSTLIRILCQLYTPQAGRISVDGVDLEQISPDVWRRQLGVIFQDFVHYDLSLADNVGLARVSLLNDRAALRQALAKAGIGDLPEYLPQGWDTILAAGYAAGVELSGGQWQRVALARALLAVDAGAKLLILDEPTANLDVRAEIELFERFLDLTRGITTILVSHRLSSVRRADRIVVLEAGKAVEDGSHAQLMDSDGRYARMFRLQAARFTAGGRDG